MTPEQWWRLTPAQQQAHAAQYGPPPPGWGPWPPHPGPVLIPPRPPKKGSARGWAIGILSVIVLLLFIGVSGNHSSTPTVSTSGATANAQAAVDTPPPPAKPITARDWAKIAKDPDVHVGESIIVYGQVTQFDTATGTDQFRANVDGVLHTVEYGFAGYETNTILVVDSNVNTDNLVEKDLFQANAVVDGTSSYTSTLNGSITTPKLRVTKLTVLGTAN